MKEYKEICHLAKSNFYRGKIAECHTDQKQLFKIINSLLHRTKDKRLPSSTDALMEFIHRLPPEFDFSSETQGGASCLTFLPCYLPDIISSDNQYPLQSDAIESFTKQEYTMKKPYVMITSTRCDLYRGTVPVAISVLF